MAMVVMVMAVAESRSRRIKCPRCGYEWEPRTLNPKKCPRCGQWLPGWRIRKGEEEQGE